MDHFQDLRTDMVLQMQEVGMDIECHHHEVATAGQCEIDQRFNTLLKSADNMMKYKYVIKSVANQYGKTVTFMPKPIFGDNGSGMHTHQSLWNKGKPLFAGDKYAGLSQMALWYAGGLLKHGAQHLGLHRAHHELLQAPRARLRSSGEPGLLQPQPLRRRAHPDVLEQPQGQAPRIPSARPILQPYLAFSAMLMAGLDGIENKIDPGKPLDKDIFELSKEELKNVPSMPGSLDEALEALEADHKYLTKGGVFSQDLIDMWIEYKKKNEVGPRPHAPAPVRVPPVLRHLTRSVRCHTERT